MPWFKPKSKSKSNQIVRGWGKYGSGDGEFDGVMGIASSSEGLIYTADCRNYRVQCFLSDGSFVRKWGTRGTANGRFMSPCKLMCNHCGVVYVVDSENQSIQLFQSDGRFV